MYKVRPHGFRFDEIGASPGIVLLPNTNFLTYRNGGIGAKAMLTGYFCSIS
jgi:hypothetical protein